MNFWAEKRYLPGTEKPPCPFSYTSVAVTSDAIFGEHGCPHCSKIVEWVSEVSEVLLRAKLVDPEREHEIFRVHVREMMHEHVRITHSAGGN